MMPLTLTMRLGRGVLNQLLQAGRHWLQHTTELENSLAWSEATRVTKAVVGLAGHFLVPGPPKCKLVPSSLFSSSLPSQD